MEKHVFHKLALDGSTRALRMSESASHIDRKVLSDAFQQYMQGWRLKAAVFLTFRFDPGFFEQEVLPLFFDIPLSHAPLARVLHLADALRETGPIAVYYDRRALESGAASARTDYQRIGLGHRTGYFHPKNAFLLVESDQQELGDAPRQQRRLIVASLSANLTRAGWWENVEVAHVEQVDEKQLCAFRDDLLGIFALLRRQSPAETDHAALDAIHAFVRSLEQDGQRLSGGLLVPRLFTGDRDLIDFLDEIAGHRLRNRCLEVISPYFDDSESTKPLRRLIDRFRPRETRVFLPIGWEGEALCSEKYWAAIRDIGAQWSSLPAEVVRLSRDTDRVVHAKVYRFFDPDDRRETFFVGSVNLTNAGFDQHGNVESGFLVEREGRRRSDWWLEVTGRQPERFVATTESAGLEAGPGTDLVLRFDWTTESAVAFWDSASDSPRLTLEGSGVKLGEIGPFAPRQTLSLDPPLAHRLKEHLLSSSFVTVCVDNAPDSVILVVEDGAVDKPSLMSTISADEILRYWSLLSDAQKQEFFETHAGQLNDEEREMWLGGPARPPAADGIFGTFAHAYLSFGNLERAVRRALSEGRRKEAVDRLFGKKFDSLRSLVERIASKAEPEPVRDYIAILCAIQLLDVLRAEERDFYASEHQRFSLRAEAQDLLRTIKTRFAFAEAAQRQQFFDWFEPWFLRRAAPAGQEVSA
jgi:hypothetical protein